MEHVSLIKVFTSFAMMGAEWVMWILVGLSVLSIAVAIDLWLYHRSMRDDVGKLADDVNRLLRSGDVDGAALRLQKSPSPAALVALAGLYEAPRGAEACEHVMQSALARTKPKLERNLTLLATIGNNAPFIGLFGTVIGIIQAFDALKPPPSAGHMGAAAAAAAAAAAQAATGRVMGTIAEALVATAIGLLVAIPAVGTYNLFQRRVKLLLGSVESLAQVILAYARGHVPEAAGLSELVALLREEREEHAVEKTMIFVDADDLHDGKSAPPPALAAN